MEDASLDKQVWRHTTDDHSYTALINMIHSNIRNFTKAIVLYSNSILQSGMLNIQIPTWKLRDDKPSLYNSLIEDKSTIQHKQAYKYYSITIAHFEHWQRCFVASFFFKDTPNDIHYHWWKHRSVNSNADDFIPSKIFEANSTHS